MATFLFIDGTNLYAGQYELFGPKKYLYFPSFIKEIETKLKIEFDQIYFYASYSPKPQRFIRKSIPFLKNESFFYKSVRLEPKTSFFLGHRSPTSGKEKEVDVKLVVDIVHKAHLNEFSACYLLSGDADFIPALKTAQSLKKNIFVACLQNKIMWKAVYNFKTSIISFSSRKKFRFHNVRQQVKIIRLSQTNQLIRSVK